MVGDKEVIVKYTVELRPEELDSLVIALGTLTPDRYKKECTIMNMSEMPWDELTGLLHALVRLR